MPAADEPPREVRGKEGRVKGRPMGEPSAPAVADENLWDLYRPEEGQKKTGKTQPSRTERGRS